MEGIFPNEDDDGDEDVVDDDDADEDDDDDSDDEEEKEKEDEEDEDDADDDDDDRLTDLGLTSSGGQMHELVLSPFEAYRAIAFFTAGSLLDRLVPCSTNTTGLGVTFTREEGAAAAVCSDDDDWLLADAASEGHAMRSGSRC